MCQGIKDAGLKKSVAHAIDTWKGDKHSGFYGDDVIRNVMKIKNNHFDDFNIQLVRKTFDEAVNDFEDNSIDLLHVDGLHTYEAVKHDYENWKSKVKNTGAVFFHDISERNGDFGVYKLWEDLKKNFYTFDFFSFSWSRSSLSK